MILHSFFLFVVILLFLSFKFPVSANPFCMSLPVTFLTYMILMTILLFVTYSSACITLLFLFTNMILLPSTIKTFLLCFILSFLCFTFLFQIFIPILFCFLILTYIL